MDEKQQPSDANQCQQHCAGHSRHRRERVRHGTGGGQSRHAIGEGAEEDAQGPLRAAVPHETDQDSRRELHRRERERHQQDSENDRHDRHDRGRYDPENRLSDLRVLARGKQCGWDPGRDCRIRFLNRRHHGPAQAKRNGDDHRADEKASA